MNTIFLADVNTVAPYIMMFLWTLAIMFGIFMLIRFILLWYWRINTIVSNQEEQIMLLQQIVNELRNKEKAL